MTRRDTFLFSMRQVYTFAELVDPCHHRQTHIFNSPSLCDCAAVKLALRGVTLLKVSWALSYQ